MIKNSSEQTMGTIIVRTCIARGAKLSAGVWTDLARPIIGLGTSQRALDAIGAGATQRFYRLLEFP
jgi:hypothetical protein